MWRRTMETKTVTVKFGGQYESVDVNTFTRVLLDYSDVVRASCKEVDPNATVDTSVRTTRPGCLEVDLGVIAQGIGDLFKDPSTSMQTIVNGIAIASAFYGFKKFLGEHGKATGAEEKGAGKSKVYAEDGAHIVVDNRVTNLYVNYPRANEAVSASFAAMDEDPKIESMSIIDGDEVAFSATRTDFSKIASSPAYESPDSRTVEEHASLTVVKPVLERSTSRKWEFLWRGIRITANIRDKGFIDRLEREAFTIGTQMEADIKIYQSYSDELGGFVNKRFEVIEVGKVDPPTETRRLF